MAILVVDDSLSGRAAMQAILQSIGYPEVILAASAEECLQILRSPAKTGTIHLILMDLMMAGMDGIEAIRAIKSDPTSRSIPIIMITASEEEEKTERAFEAGAIDYINKPVRRLELRARVRSVLRLREEQERRMARERELERAVKELKESMARVKMLSGLLPICMNCKKVRNDKGYWTQVELYVQEHSEAEFTHGICPDCVRKLYPEVADAVLDNQPQPD